MKMFKVAWRDINLLAFRHKLLSNCIFIRSPLWNFKQLYSNGEIPVYIFNATLEMFFFASLLLPFFPAAYAYRFCIIEYNQHHIKSPTFFQSTLISDVFSEYFRRAAWVCV